MAAPTQSNLPEPPAQLKAIQSYMRMAQDIDRVDPVVAYWLRMSSIDIGMKIDKSSDESKRFLLELVDWLEKFKRANSGNETVTNQLVGQAHYENFTMALFNKADTSDRAGTANKTTVRMFFMASVLFEAMTVFGPLSDEIIQRAKYAKFKAAYIQKCLKTGQTPKPGPIEGADLEGDGSGGGSGTSQVGDSATQPPLPPTLSDNSAAPNSSLPQMPMPGGISSNSTTTPSGGLYIPEVPKDPSDTRVPAAAVDPPKPTDPYILTPSVPPSSSKPTPSTLTPAMSQHQPGSKMTIADARISATNGAPLYPEDILKGQKYCKFATSALQYDDIPTAVDHLQKALKLLTTGQKSD